MKKILLVVMALIVSLGLVGCDETTENYQAQIDLLYEEKVELFEVVRKQQAQIEQLQSDLDVLYSTHAVEQSMLFELWAKQELLDDYWEEEFEQEVISIIESQELSQEEQILLMNIALVDTNIYLYEQEETHTEEDIAYYNALLIYREQLVEALNDYEEE